MKGCYIIMDQSTGQMIQLISTTVIIVVAFYFLLIRPQSKQKKEEDEMRKNLEIGDEIVTIGGIVGRVVNINDDTDTMVMPCMFILSGMARATRVIITRISSPISRFFLICSSSFFCFD